jgi:DNA mismatch repair ATPase MutS
MIMGVILNGLFLWDIHCIIRLEKWRNLNSEHLPEWLYVIAEFDALLSFGGFWFNNPDYTRPVLKQGTFVFKSESISHPLIYKTERIANDLNIEKPGHIILITGSNMAGKSTFLRSIGVNLILGMAGGPVCAKHLEFTPIPIFTSMRIGDSILDGESTFYAELKRLKRIIDHFEAGGKALVILDEIFKGTNSKDKHLGSEILIRQLINYDADVLVATHDLELCRLENELPDHVYILRKGICKTMNAKELMKQIGISVDSKK